MINQTKKNKQHELEIEHLKQEHAKEIINLKQKTGSNLTFVNLNQNT